MSEHHEEPMAPPVPAEPLVDQQVEENRTDTPGYADPAPGEDLVGEGGDEGAAPYDGGDIPPAPAEMVEDAESQREAHDDRLDANLD
jgi:hypothetical protein